MRPKSAEEVAAFFVDLVHRIGFVEHVTERICIATSVAVVASSSSPSGRT